MPWVGIVISIIAILYLTDSGWEIDFDSIKVRLGIIDITIRPPKPPEPQPEPPPDPVTVTPVVTEVGDSTGNESSYDEILQNVDRIYNKELNDVIFRKPIGEKTLLSAPYESSYIVTITAREGSHIDYEVQTTIEGRQRPCPVIVYDE